MALLQFYLVGCLVSTMILEVNHYITDELHNTEASTKIIIILMSWIAVAIVFYEAFKNK